jgi:hypothetical protein
VYTAKILLLNINPIEMSKAELELAKRRAKDGDLDRYIIWTDPELEVSDPELDFNHYKNHPKNIQKHKKDTIVKIISP